MPLIPLKNQGIAVSGFDRQLQSILFCQARAIASLLFRIVTLPILVTLLCRESSGFGAVRPLLEALAGLLALFPFFLTWGRLVARRIALGRAALDAAAYDDADRALAPLFGGGASSRLFDVAGEGRFALALTRRALGRNADAARLFSVLAREIGTRSEWGRRAQTEQEKATLP